MTDLLQLVSPWTLLSALLPCKQSLFEFASSLSRAQLMFWQRCCLLQASPLDRHTTGSRPRIIRDRTLGDRLVVHLLAFETAFAVADR